MFILLTQHYLHTFRHFDPQQRHAFMVVAMFFEHKTKITKCRFSSPEWGNRGKLVVFLPDRKRNLQ